MVTPAFPSLIPRYVDNNWYHLDKAVDEDSILTALEKEHQNSINEIMHKDSGNLTHGSQAEHYEEEEEEDDDDNNDDDESPIDSEEDEEEDEDMAVDDPWIPPSPVFNSSNL